MKGIEKALEVLGDKIASLEIDLFLKTDENLRLKQEKIEKRPSTAKAEETR